MVSRLLAQGHSVDTLQLLLGHSELNHVKPYLDVSREKLIEAFATVI
ncbi:hypothetical protein F2P46_25730 [Massilia sp. CCM 8734]|nr:hypothetical protein [Massilia sp. CCM 8734]